MSPPEESVSYDCVHLEWSLFSVLECAGLSSQAKLLVESELS